MSTHRWAKEETLKTLLIVMLFVAMIFGFTHLEGAEDMPVIVSPNDKDDIGSMHLVIYEHFGTINGYVVFKDKNGKMCSIKTNSWHAKISIPSSGGGYEKTVELTPDKFQWITTKGKDELWAYKLEPIFVDKNKIKEEHPTIYFKLKLTDWEDSAGVY